MMRIANAPCSWGVLEFELEGQAAGYRRVLDEIRDTGYEGTELGDWGFMPTEPEILDAELGGRGLALLGAFVPVDFSDRGAHQPGAVRAVRTARLLAAVAATPVVVLADENGKDPVRTRHAGRITPGQGLDEAGWRAFAEGVEAVAREVLDATGVRSVFHHHCAGFVETPAEVESLMRRTDPELVGLCFDTGHYAFGGGDPIDGIRRHADRIRHVHFKDHDPVIAALVEDSGWDYFEAVRRGIFCELGRGAVDFPGVLRELDWIGYKGWIVVEQDVLPGLGSPAESAGRNRAFLRDLGL
ncbi:MAG TPA: TIM barrel protein [Anaerolineales bacterium]|nr:TIM barrel protein [Anaerolineales bacterium]